MTLQFFTQYLEIRSPFSIWRKAAYYVLSLQIVTVDAAACSFSFPTQTTALRAEDLDLFPISHIFKKGFLRRCNSRV